MINENYPKVLIVGTTPYSPNESSRALDTYFHNWPKDKLAMVYSNNVIPPNDFCGSYFRVTDVEVFKRIFNKKSKAGNPIFFKKNPTFQNNENNKKIIKILKKKTFIRYYLRKFIWKKKRWLSNSLERWVLDFNPDIIYICFSDDYFILDIAYYFSQKLCLPTIAQIGDDYFFKKYSLLMRPYISIYKKLFCKIMSQDGFGVYISDKLTNKYNSFFKKQGFTVFLSSDINPSLSNGPINFEFNYFGKINLGRDRSLMLLGDALKAINPSFVLNVFCNSISKYKFKHLQKHNCLYRGFLEHNKVVTKMSSGSFNIIASGFSKRDIESARYSLSTKVADSLASYGPIIAIGPVGDGAIDFLIEKKCAIIIDEPKIDSAKLSNEIMDLDLLKNRIEIAQKTFLQLNDNKQNRERFETACFHLASSFNK